MTVLGLVFYSRYLRRILEHGPEYLTFNVFSSLLMSTSSVLHRAVSGQQKKMSCTPLEQAGVFNSMDLLSSQDTWTLGTKTP